MEKTFVLIDEAQTQALGQVFARCLLAPFTGYFCGELGSGKTTLIRSILRQLGVRGSIKSPSFTLIEPYELSDLTLYHMDLYRLNTPDELEWLGIRDYFQANTVCLIEWPERGGHSLPPADLSLTLAYLDVGRALHCVALTPTGEGILKQLMREYFVSDQSPPV